MAGYFLNPNTGFTPSSPLQGWTPGSPVSAAGNNNQTPASFGNQMRRPTTGNPETGSPPWQTPTQAPQYGSSAVRPTDQGGPQQAWMQNMATYAGGNLAGSSAFGPTGPVRRLVDVLGQNPFGEQNPMTLLMQALQSSNFGMPLPAQPTTPQFYKPPTYSEPGWGGPSRPVGFNPRQMYNMP